MREHVPDVVGLLRRDWGDDVAVGVAGDGEPWGAEVAVLEASSRVVGHCSWDVDRRGSCELTFLSVAQEHRKKGIGSLLVGHTVQRVLHRTDVKSVFVTCEAAMEPFYRRCGFFPSRSDGDGDEGEKMVKMVFEEQ